MKKRLAPSFPLLAAAFMLCPAMPTHAQDGADGAAPPLRAQKPAAKPVQAQPRKKTKNHSEGNAAQERAPGNGAGAEPGLTGQILYQTLLGEIAAQRGRYDLALSAYLDLARRTRDPRAAARAFELAHAARHFEAALEAARLWRAADPGSPRARQALLGLLLGIGKAEELQPALRDFVAGADSPGTAWLELGAMLAQGGGRNELFFEVERLAGEYADLPETHYTMARAAHASRRPERALAEIGRALELRPDWEEAALTQAQLLHQTRGGAAAEAALAVFVARNPGMREARILHARLLIGERRYEEARAEFGRLAETFPDDAEVIYAQALLSLQLGDRRAAETGLKRLLGMNFRDANNVHFYLGQIAEAEKRDEDALAAYAGVSDGEQFLPAQLRVAQILLRAGKLDEARRRLAAAAEARPAERVRLQAAEAQLLREAGRGEEGLAFLESLLAADPDQQDLLYETALFAEKLGRFDLLESHLGRLIALNPAHAHARNALGYSFAERGIRLDEARRLIVRALEIEPDNAFIIDSMGWVLFRQGDLRGAQEQLERAYRGRDDPEIAAHLGEVLWQSGRREEARRIWDEARRRHPGNEALEATLRRFRH